MKLVLAFSALMMFGPMFGTAAFADVPPPPGTVVEDKIEGTAAQILAHSLTEEIGQLPAGLPFQSECGEHVASGKVHVARRPTSSVRIACAEYYCRGHRARCVLTETH